MRFRESGSKRLRCAGRRALLSALALVVGWCGALPVAATAQEEPADLALFAAKVAGRYAHYDIVAYTEPLVLGAMRTLVITYGFTDLAVVDGQLTSTESFCHAEHKSNLPITTTVADAFTRAIKPSHTPVAITYERGQYRVWRPETPTALGIVLADPNEPLPLDPNDPRIVDADADGKPGVTVHVKLGGLVPVEIYLVRREIFAYDLRWQADGRFVGVVHDRSEQLVVGASQAALAAPRRPVQESDLAKSPVLLVPVGSSYDCERLMQERDRLFPPVPRVVR